MKTLLAVGDRKDFDTFMKLYKQRRFFYKSKINFKSIDYDSLLKGALPKIRTKDIIVFLCFPFNYWDKYIEPKNYKGVYGNKSFYVKLRNTGSVGDDAVKPIPISARQLESLVRLSEASAKIRLSGKVTRLDARKAIIILQDCLKAVGFDYETGQFDIDRISTGLPSAQRSKIILIREIVDKFDKEGKKTIPIEDIIAEASEKNIDEGKVEEIQDWLKRLGVIIEDKITINPKTEACIFGPPLFMI